MLKKKKQVHFGDPLSPEFFDKNLPPSTPLQKGGTPARAPTPGGSLQLRSVLKTPHTSESNTPHHQLELYIPSEFGASPTLAIPHKRRRLSEEADGEDGKVGNASGNSRDESHAVISVPEAAGLHCMCQKQLQQQSSSEELLGCNNANTFRDVYNLLFLEVAGCDTLDVTVRTNIVFIFSA